MTMTKTHAKTKTKTKTESVPVYISFLTKFCNRYIKTNMNMAIQDKDKDKDKDKKTERPNMCHIFENDMTQGCQI